MRTFSFPGSTPVCSWCVQIALTPLMPGAHLGQPPVPCLWIGSLGGWPDVQEVYFDKMFCVDCFRSRLFLWFVWLTRALCWSNKIDYVFFLNNTEVVHWVILTVLRALRCLGTSLKMFFSLLSFFPVKFLWKCFYTCTSKAQRFLNLVHWLQLVDDVGMISITSCGCHQCPISGTEKGQ